MKYICEKCGELIDEEDLVLHAHYLDDLCSPTMMREYTCHCGGTPIEVGECSKCGEYEYAETLRQNRGVCDKCYTPDDEE